MTTTLRRAFTMIELMVVLGIIALLGSIVLLALGKVRKSGDITAERAMVVALKNGVEQFRQQFGFLPPLVVDEPVGAAVPVDLNGNIAIWSTSDLYDSATTLNGSTGPADRRCYSKYSLPYYLDGALDDLYDGVTGAGFTAPSSSNDGTFSRRGRTHDPIVNAFAQKTRVGHLRRLGFTSDLARPDLETLQPLPADKDKRAERSRHFYILDRWSDGTTANTLPIRYYRWLPDFWPRSNVAQAGQVRFWNVPFVVGGDPANTNPPANIELKSAEWAIVSAGPDRLFGDEGGTYNAEAVRDNIVEVGR